MIRTGAMLVSAVVGLLALAALGSAAPTAAGDSPPDAGTAFEPAPQSQEDYGVSEPTSDPDSQTHYVRAKEDPVTKQETRIYTETYLPKQKDGGPPVPEKLPTILIYSPYEAVAEAAIGTAFGFSPSKHSVEVARYWAARGYAVTVAHARGTAKSDGCNDYLGELERDDISQVIQYVGGEVEGDPPPAPWASGSVGMYGISYYGATQVAAATLGAKEHPERAKYLKAIVPLAPSTSEYALTNSDGVPYRPVAVPVSTAAMLVFGTPDSGRATDRASCQVSEHAAETARSWVSGDFTPWFAEREFRREARNVKVPLLMTSNLFDAAVQPSHAVGFFNYLPPQRPHKIVLPARDHAAPEHEHPQGWQREKEDWRKTLTAWYDRWLKGLDTGVERWPAAQVQEATTGQWHTEDSWPPLRAPEGKLALGPAPAPDALGDIRPAGLLGETRPSGSTTYSEASGHPNPADGKDRGGGDNAIWESKPLAQPLHLTGEPRLDLWVKLDRPDAHIVANLQAFSAPTDDAPGGKPLLPLVADGRRSARHLDPLIDERFEQSEGKPPPQGPFLVQIRLWPVDVVVPAGGRLRLSLAGVTPTANSSLPSEAATNVEVLHDCTHQSVLRFRTPSPGSKLLNVREPDEKDLDPLPSNPLPAMPQQDGGGIGDRPICK